MNLQCIRCDLMQIYVEAKGNRAKNEELFRNQKTCKSETKADEETDCVSCMTHCEIFQEVINRLAFRKLLIANLTWLKIQGQVVWPTLQGWKKRQKQEKYKKRCFSYLRKISHNRRGRTLQKANCNMLKIYQWFISPVSKIFFDLNLMYISQGSIHLDVAFTTRGINAAVTTPSEEQMLFSSSCIKKEILGVLEEFGA